MAKTRATKAPKTPKGTTPPEVIRDEVEAPTPEEVAAAPPLPPSDPGVELFRNRNRKIVRVKASSLVVNPLNWRLHPEYQSAALTKLLEKVGFVGTLIVREIADRQYELIDGHLRRDLLGDQEVDVIVVDLTDDEMKLILSTHDQVTSLAQPDNEKLKNLLSGLRESGVQLTEVGWPEYKLDQVLNAGWVPAAAPMTSTGVVTPEQVEAAKESIEGRFTKPQELSPVMCPHCAREFMVDPASLKPKEEKV